MSSSNVPFFDSVPVIAQLKSLVQVIFKDVKGARLTQENFSRTCIVVSQVRSMVELAAGDKLAARQTQLTFLRVGLRNGNAFINGVPVVGHIKGGIHYALDDKNGGHEAMKASSRTVGVIAGALGGALIGGPAVAAAGGVGGGLAVDTLSTAIESAVNRRYSPSGTLALGTELVRNHSDAGAVFDAAGGFALTVALDGVGGALVGQGARLVATNNVPSAAAVSMSALDHVGIALRVGSGVGSSTLAHFNQRDGRIRWRLAELNLLCRNGCGWYGTLKRNGLCGKCWRLKKIGSKQTHMSQLKFEKFQQKRRRISERRFRTVKDALGLESDDDQCHLRIIKHTHRRRYTEKFEVFLTDLSPSLATEISKQTEETIDMLFELQHYPTETLSEKVQKLFLDVSDIIKNYSENDSECSASEVDVVDRVEQYVCVLTYPILFCASEAEEKEETENLEWIDSIKWVKKEFVTKQETPEFINYIEQAGQELMNLNAVRSAADKLACIVRCFIHLTAASTENRGSCSADDLFPTTVYAVLNANPPCLQANLDFVVKFGQPYQVSNGDSGYAYTTLDAAFTFLRNLEPSILEISQKEWDEQMSKGAEVVSEHIQ
uniref:VPS9 domain-containing protein n=1 Tax=Plectus sambesii TaxID=2011161 RepID=A0A914VSG6_9BILA